MLSIGSSRDSMKKLYVCGSFRFAREMECLETSFSKENVEYQISKKMDTSGILGCLRRIGRSRSRAPSLASVSSVVEVFH